MSEAAISDGSETENASGVTSAEVVRGGAWALLSTIIPQICTFTTSIVIAGSSMKAIVASITSRRLCGGMFVAMPTAMPTEPLTSRFGKRAGRIDGSWVRPS